MDNDFALKNTLIQASLAEPEKPPSGMPAYSFKDFQMRACPLES
jgi:hypothetical protein